MHITEQIRVLCAKLNISQAELARRIGQTPQNFNGKIKRNTLSISDLEIIAKSLGVEFEYGFILSDKLRI